MAGVRRLGSGCTWWWSRCGTLGLCLGVPVLALPCAAQRAAAKPAHGTPAPTTSRKPKSIGDPWQTALAARRSFEAEPKEEHTRDEFTQVMDNFRAIYHGDPASLHAPAAADQVAELLAEQGRELNDRKSSRAAAGQYEFLAKAYPASSLAAPALAHAIALLAAGGPEDQAETRRLRLELKERYPRAEGSREIQVALAGTPEGQPATPASVDTQRRERLPSGASPARADVVTTASLPSAEPVSSHSPSREPAIATRVDDEAGLEGRPLPAGVAPAVVTGIRHWSTASYTRVAIDLGGEVQFQAARTEHPDRIFFDLHGATLAPGLVGKTFAVTDDGFLSTIRAAQAGADVTRVVLDVQPVAEYSAFLLLNPYRLIIDIHGKQPGIAPTGGQPTAVAESPISGNRNQSAKTSGRRERDLSDTDGDRVAIAGAEPVAPIERSAPAQPTGGSTLPPMPVTDGSASFGLPPKRNLPATSEASVARPRVVVTAKPTTAHPVPNTVTSATPDSSREVAALSNGPGVVPASAKPSSKPVVERSTIRRTNTSDTAGSLPGAAPTAPPPPTADGQSTLMRALGLKIGRIVIDAGHGGHDSGTLGPGGIEEKDVVLDVALRLGKLLHDRLGAEVVYTRADDTFIPLETRTAIANKAQADLFISVHANSSQDPSARGVEVYYLNFTSDPEAMQVASRENAVSSGRVNQLSDLVKKIALKDKIDESRELAADVDQSLYAGLKKGNSGLKDRGVKKAPFVVLIGANMPSVLAEISFVTNPTDADQLQEPEYRERVAESLYNGIARYASEINGARPKPRITERAER